MRILLKSLIIIFFILSATCCYSRDLPDEKVRTWLTPSPNLQIYIEGKDDRKGLGRIFVPAMTSGADEPLYAVFQDGKLVGEENTGASFFVKPGRYEVVLGSGTLNQRIRRPVEIISEETVIINPDWCALTIEVIDEVRNYQELDLHIFDFESAQSYGIIPAINPELGEHLETLILPGGLYKIVKRGEDFNTYINFTTLLIEPGTYTPYTVVVDNESNDFIGAGIITAASQQSQRRNLTLFAAVHGFAELTSSNDESSEDIKIDLSILTQFENRLLYDRFPHYYLSNNLLDIGTLLQKGTGFIINRDRLQLKNTYVYYLLGWLGGYSRYDITTHLFPTVQTFKNPVDVFFLDLNLNTLKQNLGVKETHTAPALFPFEMKEGLGLNITPLKTFMVRLSLRTGFGFRQTYNRDVYQESSRTDNTRTFRLIENSFRYGLETRLVSYLSLLRNLSITTDLDVFFPFNEWRRPEFDLENFISLIVVKNVTVEHTLRLEKKPADRRYTIQEQFISVRFSYFFFQ